MKNYTITVNGNVYDVTVEEGTGSVAAPAAPAAAPAAPKAAPAPAPAPPPRQQPPRLPREQPVLSRLMRPCPERCAELTRL